MCRGRVRRDRRMVRSEAPLQAQRRSRRAWYRVCPHLPISIGGGEEEEWGYIDPCESSCPTTRVKGPRGGMGGKAATPAWSGRGSKLVAAHPSPPVPCSRAEHDQTWGRKGGGRARATTWLWANVTGREGVRDEPWLDQASATSLMLPPDPTAHVLPPPSRPAPRWQSENTPVRGSVEGLDPADTGPKAQRGPSHPWPHLRGARGGNP